MISIYRVLPVCLVLYSIRKTQSPCGLGTMVPILQMGKLRLPAFR